LDDDALLTADARISRQYNHDRLQRTCTVAKSMRQTQDFPQPEARSDQNSMFQADILMIQERTAIG
jgi:hypothetical protein